MKNPTGLYATVTNLRENGKHRAALQTPPVLVHTYRAGVDIMRVAPG